MSDPLSIPFDVILNSLIVFGVLISAIASVAIVRMRSASSLASIMFCSVMVIVGIAAIASAKANSPLWPFYGLILCLMVVCGTLDWHGHRSPASL